MADELVTRGTGGLAAADSALERWGEMREMAAALAKSGMMPKSLSSPEAVLAVILTGRELGMGPMQAARSLHYVEGRVVMDASAQLALAIGSGVQVEWVTTTDTEATCVLSRRGWTASYRSTYTIAMAQRAGLAGRSTWRGHTEAMLRARAITAGIRAYCPDVLGAGVYSPDEADDIRATSAPRESPPADVARSRPLIVGRAAPAVVVDVAVAPVEPAPSRHHASWSADRARFCGALRAAGLAYADVAAWAEAKGGGRPSAWTDAARLGLSRALASPEHPKRADLDAWLAARAVTDDGREPGEEG